jgi:hypothetical protein
MNTTTLPRPMSGTWPHRLAYRTGPTISPRACRCLAQPPPNTLLNTNPVPARATHSRIPRHTHGRTLFPVPTTLPRATSYHRDHSSYRPRSHSQSSSRLHATRSYTFVQPTHSRTYSYALHYPPATGAHPTSTSSATSFTDASHPATSSCVARTTHRVWGTYVIGAPAVGGVPPQIRMHNAVRIPHSLIPIRMAWC